MYQHLPSIAECQTFLAKINEGRALIDLPPIGSVDFDACTPNNGAKCLSATYLYGPAGWFVGSESLTEGYSGDEDERVLTLNGGRLDIPDEILAVTGPFDALESFGDDSGDPRFCALRARFVEAGIVAD